jgi:hypothetical protein
MLQHSFSEDDERVGRMLANAMRIAAVGAGILFAVVVW